MSEQTFVFLEEYYPPYDRWFENRIYPSADGISIFFHDISERKRADAALQTTEAQLHELLAQLQRAQEAERIRISRQIHDELGQLLTGLKMDLRWLERKLCEPGVPAAFNALLDRTVAASELNDQTIATVQRIAAELRPAALDQLGLSAALTQAARRFQARSGVPCAIDVPSAEPVLPPTVAGELFYICQEALTNVTRHAQATEVAIELRTRDGEVVLEVRDNGVGIDPAKINGRHSLGLLGMRERALQCRGALQVQAIVPRGTCVTVRVPVPSTVEGIAA
jgi:signal transduction histidine kinase